MTIPNTQLPEPHVLVGAALFLMTKHAQSRCPGLCQAIAQQFAWLARHPARDIPAEQRRLYRQLALEWAEMAAAHDPRRTGHDGLAVGIGAYLQ